MDGDNTAKTFEQGANSAVKENEMTSGLHETVKQTVCFCPSAMQCSAANLHAAGRGREDWVDRDERVR